METKIIDIHSHVIPCVDDGSDSFHNSIRMLRIAEDQGVDKLFLTSHSEAFNVNPDYVKKQYDELITYAEDLFVCVDMYLGCEIFTTESNIDKVINKLQNGIYPTMNGTRFVLIEFDPYNITWKGIYNCCDKILDSNYFPIVAHAERYKFDDIDDVHEIKRIGGKIQCNLFSVAQTPNIEHRLATEQLIEEEIIDYVGSDAHRFNRRNFEVKVGAEYLQKKYHNEYINEILYTNAFEDLINGGE